MFDLPNITLHCVCFVRGRRSAAMVVGTSCTTTKCKKKVSLSYPYPTVFVLKWFLILSNSYLTETGSLGGCFAVYQVVTKISLTGIGRPTFRRKLENQVHCQCMPITVFFPLSIQQIDIDVQKRNILIRPDKQPQ